jgi:hypothetical protein
MSTSVSSPTAADHAAAYRAAGWGVLFLPEGEKSPPPTGYTGEHGAWATDDDIVAWHRQYGDAANIAIRLPETVIGIDVDAYEDKAGAATLAHCEELWGALPATFVSTARTDGVSGIRLFRVPMAGLDWPGVAGPGIEVIQYRHRYAVVAPSLNPKTGTSYRWVAPGGDLSDATVNVDIPHVDTLPVLPEAWVRGLTGGQLAEAGLPISDVDTSSWLNALSEGEPCEEVQETLRRALDALENGGSRYEAMRDGTWALVDKGRGGCTGVGEALDTLHDAYTVAVFGEQRDPNEWYRALHTAVAKVAAVELPLYQQCYLIQYEQLRFDIPDELVEVLQRSMATRRETKP